MLNSLRAELKYWKANSEGDTSEQGCVVNVGSLNSKTPCPGGSTYCAAKWAILSTSQSAAVEHSTAAWKPPVIRKNGNPNTPMFGDDIEMNWVPKIRINTVLPGLIDTAFTR